MDGSESRQKTGSDLPVEAYCSVGRPAGRVHAVAGWTIRIAGVTFATVATAVAFFPWHTSADPREYHRRPSSAVATAEHAANADYVEELVLQLGAADPTVRESAYRSLLQLGGRAESALTSGLKASDAEIRRRCRWLIEEIELNEIRQRRQEFIASADSGCGCGLPGWDRFRRIVGDTPGARPLFAAMTASEPATMIAVENTNVDAIALRLISGMMAQVRAGWSETITEAPDPVCTAVEWFGLVVLRELVPKTRSVADPFEGSLREPYFLAADWNQVFYQVADQLIQTESVAPALAHPVFGPSVRRLIGAFIEQLEYSEQWAFAADQFLQLGLAHRMPEGLRLAMSVLKSDDTSGESRAMAITYLALAGGPRYAKFIASQLSCTEVVVHSDDRHRCEVRDVALAWLVDLTGQSHADYSLPSAAEFCAIWKRSSPKGEPPRPAFSVTDAQRRTAEQKWNEYVAKHPLPEPSEESSRLWDALGKASAEAAPGEDAETGSDPAEGEAAQDNEPHDQQTEESQPAEPRWPIADRESQRLLSELEALIAQGRYASAARVLDELLAQPPTYYAPRRDCPWMCDLHRAAERIPIGWPAEAKRAYLDRYSAEAAEELSQAIAERRFDLVAQVAHRRLHTPAGAEALWLAAHRDLSRGDWLRGLWRLEYLQRVSLSAHRLEPGLSLRIAQCRFRLGMRNEAEWSLRHSGLTLSQLADAVPAWNGRPPHSWDELYRRLEEGIAVPHGSTRTAETLKTRPSQALPWLGEPPRVLAESPAAISKLIHDRLRKRTSRNQASVPIVRPLTIDNVLLYRTATHLEAVDGATGRLLWRQPLEDRLQHYQRLFADSPAWTYKKGLAGVLRSMVSEPVVPQIEANRNILMERLEQRLWHDGRFGAITSDGRRVYGIEHDGGLMPRDYLRLAVAADGRRYFEGSLPTGNLLAAYDVATGKLLWEAGSATVLRGDYRDYIQLPHVTGTDLRDAVATSSSDVRRPSVRPPIVRERPDWSDFFDLRFLGPPLPIADRLYVTAATDDGRYLLELRADDGRLNWALMLAAESPAEFHFEPLLLLALRGVSAPAQPEGACTAIGGLLICCDGERFFAVDPAERRTIWAYPLSEFEPTDDQAEFREIFDHSSGTDIGISSLWCDPPITPAGSYLLLAPSGGETLDCVSVAEGRLCWSVPRREMLYVGALERDRVAIIERGGVRCIRLEDGRLLWRQAFPNGAPPVGRGYMLGRRLLVPLREAGLPAFDLETGRIIGWHRPDPRVALGNLIPLADCVLIHTASGVFRCDDAFRAAQMAMTTAPPPQAQPHELCRHAELLLAAGEARSALEFLRRLPERVRATPTLRRLALTAAIDALRNDPAAALAQAETVLAETMQAEPEEAPTLAAALASAYEQMNRRSEAFLALLTSAINGVPTETGRQPRYDRLERAEAARQIVFDRAVSLRLEQLYCAAAPAERQQIDQRLTQLINGSAGDAALRLIAWHPLAVDALVRHAEAERESQRLYSAEWLLAQSVEAAPQERREELRLRRREVLREGLPAEIVGPGRLRHVRTDVSRTRSIEGEKTSSKPDKVNGPVSEDDEVAFVSMRRIISLRPTDHGDTAPSLQIMDTEGGPTGSVIDSLGRELGPCPFPRGGYDDFTAFGVTGRFGHLVGRLAVITDGVRVYAFDAIRPSAAPLWSHAADPADAVVAQAAFGFFAAEQPVLPGQSVSLAAVSRSAVCVQLGRRLTGIEPHTGRIVWQRDDLPYGCDLFGDGTALLVTPPNGRNTFVFDPRDGRELACLDPIDRTERFTTIGRYLILWRVEGPRRTLLCRDAVSGKTLWTHRFGEQALVCEVDPRSAAVLELDGTISLVDCVSGRLMGVLHIDPVERCRDFVVLRGRYGFDVLVADGRSGAEELGNLRLTLRRNDLFYCEFGTLYHFDHRGQRVWKVPLKSCLVPRLQPPDVPILAIFELRRGQFLHLTRRETRLVCFDRRDGSELLEQSVKRITDIDLAVVSAEDGREIEVRSPLGTAQFQSTD